MKKTPRRTLIETAGRLHALEQELVALGKQRSQLDDVPSLASIEGLAVRPAIAAANRADAPRDPKVAGRQLNANLVQSAARYWGERASQGLLN